MRTVHVVSHTHWDREWYQPAERFRQRLVALIDELLDEPAGVGFLLDGQTVVLEDYLDVKPERASELAEALRAGTLEAGPWYVLADALIPGAEGLVRNLLAGKRALRALRAEAPPVLYCPDSFGHPAALPELALGFGKPLIVIWRGFGGGTPRRDTHRWIAPSGSATLLYHLTRSGYEIGANLPADPAAARTRWQRIVGELEAREQLGPSLLLNGADHHARQRDLEGALTALAGAAKPDTVSPSTLAAFTADIVAAAASGSPPEVQGELRESYGYTWTLQGTLASRTPLKRQYALVERMLVRDVEPWTALATLHGRASRRELVHAAWKPLLLCQPHDTLCGCSIDAVARAMDGRLESAAAQGAGLREDAIHDLVGHDRDVARQAADRWDPRFLIRNPAPRARTGVALVEWTIKQQDVPVGPGSALHERRAGFHWTIPADPTRVQLLGVTEGYERLEAPRAYPDNDLVIRLLVAVWMRDALPYGVTARSIELFEDETPVRCPVAARGRSLSNGLVSLHWDRKGGVSLTSVEAGRTVRGFFGWESRIDAGDLYTPAIRGKKLKPRHLGTELVHAGPLRGVVQQTWRLAGKKEHVDLTVQVMLDAGSDVVRIAILGDNQAMDHRLRLILRTDVKNGRTVADAAFGLVERAQPKVSAKDVAVEKPVPTAPLHRYVSLFDARRGATLFADGLTEYETSGGEIAVTLLRCVGELSRNDLKERPGHAGWPAPTPEAQNIGQFEAELGVRLHGPHAPDVVDANERAADDFLYPLTGETLRSGSGAAASVHGVALEGAGLAFASMKESEDGDGVVLRCVNLLDTEVRGAWQLGQAIESATQTRLDETPMTTLDTKAKRVEFVAPPRGVVTIVVR